MRKAISLKIILLLFSFESYAVEKPFTFFENKLAQFSTEVCIGVLTDLPNSNGYGDLLTAA